MLHIGPIPPGLKVIRTCGHHWCVNPEHFQAGKPNATRDDTLAPRFFAKTVVGTRVNPNLEKPCLLYKAAIKFGKYGKVHMHSERITATHIAWFIATGEKVPTGMLVMHKCDNPPCVEISHLELGTTEKNVQDRVEKGRTAAGANHGTHTKPESVRRGKTHGMAVMTVEEVVLIRRTYDANPGEVGIVEWLTKHLGRKSSAVWFIATRKTWKHIANDAMPEILPIPLAELKKYARAWPTGDNHKLCKVSNRQVREIRLLASQNVGGRGVVKALAVRANHSDELSDCHQVLGAKIAAGRQLFVCRIPILLP
jgi:hypothetical protein